MIGWLRPSARRKKLEEIEERESAAMKIIFDSTEAVVSQADQIRETHAARLGDMMNEPLRKRRAK